MQCTHPEYSLMIERIRHCRQDVTFSFEDVIQLLTRGRKVLLAGPFLVPLERGKCNELAHASLNTSRIIIGLEINEGKEEMKNKKWQKDFGAGTATTLLLTEPWHGTGRIVVGDSWFSSVKTSIQLKERAYNLHRPALEKKSHTDFTKALALQLIKNQFGLPPETRPAEPLLIDEVNLPVEVISHVLVNLSKEDERKRVQRKCLICSRVHGKQMKASYFCKKCGPNAVMCSPQTGRDCFEYHIKNGIPLRRKN
ncbi:hypothetical protein J6590_052126 [Homalodisca vitripennis]|nr:hypothetical protein J6590_052126 [Homalodisca vitripennis]